MQNRWLSRCHLASAVDELEQMRWEMRWLASDWERRVREATERWPMDPVALKLAEQLRGLSRWDFTRRAAGPFSGVEWGVEEDFDNPTPFWRRR